MYIVHVYMRKGISGETEEHPLYLIAGYVQIYFEENWKKELYGRKDDADVECAQIFVFPDG